MDATESAILRAVGRIGGAVTESQLCGATGLAPATIAPALRSLVRRFDCVLRVTEDGEILYDFGRDLRDRLGPADRALEVARAAVALLGVAGARAFQVWMVVMLLGYGLVYSVAIWAILDRVAGRVGPFPAEAVWRAITGVLRGAFSRRAPLHERRSDWPFHERLWAFLFGATPAFPTRAARDRAFVAHAIANRGIVGASDWALLFGTSLEAAEAEVARVHADFGAGVRVTPGGTLVYDFSAFVPAHPVAGPPLLGAREAAVRAAAGGRRVAAVTLGLAALIGAGSAGCGAFLSSSAEWGGSAAAWLLVVAVPGAFSGCVFVLAAARALRSRRRVRVAAAIAADEQVRREQEELACARAAAPSVPTAGRIIYSTDDDLV